MKFRVGGHIFATLASVEHGFGNLMLTPEIQAEFVADAPDVFLPVAGGWGRMGATRVRLAKANRDVLAGALRTAWQLRVEKYSASRSRRSKTPIESTLIVTGKKSSPVVAPVPLDGSSRGLRT